MDAHAAATQAAIPTHIGHHLPMTYAWIHVKTASAPSPPNSRTASEAPKTQCRRLATQTIPHSVK